MNTWIALLWGVPAFAALSLAMERHHEQMLGKELGIRGMWLWRAVGTALLLGSLLVCLHGWGLSVAVAAWLGVLTFAALFTGLMLTYAPRQLRTVASVCAVLAVAGLGLLR